MLFRQFAIYLTYSVDIYIYILIDPYLALAYIGIHLPIELRIMMLVEMRRDYCFVTTIKNHGKVMVLLLKTTVKSG
jgi:hypothetical protein